MDNKEVFQYATRIKAILEKMADEGINDVSIKASLLKIIDKRPEILMAQLGNHRYNLGMIAADLKAEWFVLKALDYKDASLQQDYIGENIGMHAAQAQLERATLKALDNTNASVQQDCIGENIGMYAAHAKLELATLKALENIDASVQKNIAGQNIGMFAADMGLEQATIKALDNPEASVQQCVSGWNIGMCAAESALEEATLKAIRNPVARSQKNYLQNTIKTIARGAGLASVVKAYDDLAQNETSKKKKNNGAEQHDLSLDEIEQELGF